MKDLSKLFALLMMAGALLTFNACSDDDPAPDAEPEDTTAADLVGSWVMNPAAGAFKVGPGVDNGEWFSSSADDVSTRSCYFDDVYTFSADGSFSIEMGGETWLETWQGVESDACGAPVAPHNGGGDYTYGATETSLTLSGAGAYLGLPKAYNGGELNADNTTAPGSVTYTILAFNSESTPKTLKLDVAIGGEGHWTFNLISQ
jgi:hypothetical protein